MPRYVVEEETGDGKAGESHGPFEGLAVAKAVARKTAEESKRPVVVRDVDSKQQLARFEPTVKAEITPDPPSLAHSVRRLRAANDELMKVLRPLADKNKKG